MKKGIFLLFSLLFSLSILSQEYIFKFKVNSKEELRKLTSIVSIDGYRDGEVTAYANDKEFDAFKELGYSYEILPHPSVGKVINMATTVAQMENWDRYPTYDVYNQMMNGFATDYPTLCQVVNIGTSGEGRLLLAVKISDNVTQHEAEPEYFYTGTMHGDETTGFVLSLRLADWLLTNYGTDDDATYIVDHFELYINPASNPDGTYAGGNSTVAGSTRYNSNGEDLNRNFPYPLSLNSPYEIETQAMMDFADAHHFVMSANFHGGTEVMNYPWDCWTSAQNEHADDSWFYEHCYDYVQSARLISANYMTDVTPSGVTEGADWYYAYGSRQDYMTYFQNCRETTIELSIVKLLSSDDLPELWDINKQSLIDFIKPAIYGFNGTVKNSNGDPLYAKIEILAHDTDNSWVVTDPANGDYYRPIAPGTYSVTYSSEGYISQTINVTATGWYSTTVQNVVLEQAQQVDISGTVTEEGTGNPLSGVKIELLGTSIPTVYTNADGIYTVTDVYEGQHQIKASKNGYSSETQSVNVSTSNYTFDFALAISNAISFESDVPSIFTYSGNANWFRTNTDAYDGDYSMRSGAIGHDEETSIQAELNITTAGNISFYKKVSSESGYDYLRFYIDGVEKGEWSGSVDWSQQTYPVTIGNHIFKWEYSKDGSATGGEDCAWVDYIEFPEYQEPQTYIVTFNVTDGSNPIEGAGVSFNSQNITTNSIGQAIFTDVSSGSNIPWAVSKTGYLSENGLLTISGDYTKNVTLSLISYTVTFIISDGSLPINAANVTFNSEDILSDNNGYAVFSGVSPGNGLPYSVSKTGYNPFNGQLNVTNQNVEQNLVLSESVSVDVLLLVDGLTISPNPANDLVRIDFYIPSPAETCIAIYDYNGKQVKVLNQIEYEAGNHTIYWNCNDGSSKTLENGIYFCRLVWGDKTISKKIIVLR